MAQEQGSMDRFDLGPYGRTISTRSAETQRWFDIGLNWCYGFNHEEGIKCFKKALESDPGCAMVHWGIAYAAGPFYNLTWKEHGDAEANSATRRCFEHVQLARANAAALSVTTSCFSFSKSVNASGSTSSGSVIYTSIAKY